MDPIESRRAVRREITLNGSFKIKDDLRYKLHIYKEPINLTLVDVGALGCGFVTAYYLPKGLVIQIIVRGFPVISSEGIRESKDIEFTARVMACKTTPSRASRIGVEFVDIRKEDTDLIKRFAESSA